METLSITNGIVLTPAGIIHPGTLVIERGTISKIVEGKIARARGRTLDVGECYVLPGFVDLHSDCIETEVVMQKNLFLPTAAAVVNLDRKLANWGITTEFHAINFSDAPEKGRSVDQACRLVDEVIRFKKRGMPLVRHFVHVRCDPSSDPGTDRACALVQAGKVDYGSLQEHAPGVGAYKDVEFARAHYAKRYTITDETELQKLADAAQSKREVAKRNQERFARVASSHRVPLASHDDDTENKVEEMHRLGVALSEFPLSLPVASRARVLGMKICMGAPNAFRGKSLYQEQNHLSARQAVQAGLVDILCADYYPPSLVYATFRLAQLGFLSLIQAVSLVSLKPAIFVGRGDRVGSLEEGKEADIAIVRIINGIPIVACTIAQGKIVQKMGF